MKQSALLLPLLIILSFTGCSDKQNNLPQRLGDLTLRDFVEGNEAKRVIYEMHGKTFGADNNIIGYYGDKNSKNLLYVSIFENAEKARQDLMNMSVKMAGGTAVFKPLTFDKMGNNVHFRTEGMGLTHYFYRVDNTIVWWQVRPDKAEATYKDLLNFKFFQDLAD